MISLPVRFVSLVTFIAGCLFASSTSYGQGCMSCPGDMNGDGIVRGDDIQSFTTCLTAGQAPTGGCACADLDRNGAIDQEDLPILTAALTRTAILVPSISVGKDLQERIVITIAPRLLNDTTVTLTSDPPGQLVFSIDPSIVGSPTLALPASAGCSTLPPVFVQALGDAGSISVTASVAGYAPGVGTVTLQPSGFVILSPGNFSTAPTSANMQIRVRSARLEPGTLAFIDDQPLRGGIGSVSVNVTSSNVTVGTITTSPLTFSANALEAVTQFHPVAAGSANITLGTPSGFLMPSNRQQVTATVNNNTLSFSNFTLGKDLQETGVVSLGNAAPAGGLTVTLTSGDANRVLLSTSATGSGQASVTVAVAAGSTNSSTFYVQGIGSSGSVSIVATAPNYTDATRTVTLSPSGFIFLSSSFSTTSFSTNTPLDVRPARLDPTTLAYSTYQSLRGGIAPVSVGVTSSNIAVGSITISPISFNSNSSTPTIATAFDPSGAGSSVLGIIGPAGFDTPSNMQQITATVTAPDVGAGSLVNVGVNLQSTESVFLTQTPPSPVDLTVTSGNPAIATISDVAAAAGGASVTFANVAITTPRTIYVQGRSVGSTTLSVQATGYNPKTVTVHVGPSGFVFLSSSFSTTAFSANTTLDIRSARLNANTLAYDSLQALRGGLSPVNVSVTSSNASAGTITLSPITFNAGASTATTATAFDPAGNGISSLGLQTPAGFDTPTNMQSITATVTAPDISVPSSESVGVDLQSGLSVSLSATPPSPVNITITSNNAAIVTVSDTATAAGSALVTFANVANTVARTVYVQGRSVGNTTLSVQATGFNSKTVSVQVIPSGFVFLSSGFSTTTFSANTSLDIRPAKLHPTTLVYESLQSLRGGLEPVSVGVTSSNVSTGTITVSPVTFVANSSTAATPTAFDPNAAGSSVLGLLVPAGFSVPSNMQTITATVTAPDIGGSSSVSVGKDLQQTETVWLSQTPPSPVDLTVTSNNSAVVAVTDSATAAGGAQVVFANVANTAGRSVYVQGRAIGTATLTLQANGFNSKTINVQVDPSGFITFTNSFTTTASAANTALDVRPARLDPTTLNYSTYQALAGGQPPVNVQVTSSSNAGTITVSPISFNGGLFTPVATTAFDPVTLGTCTVSVEPPAGFTAPSNLRQITATVNP